MLNLETDMYPELLSSRCRKQWEKIGVKRRAGVATPLFSVYSKKTIGVGEVPDLKLLIDWCASAGLSILQLLPVNDVGFDFRPYDAQSSFALDPMYLAIDKLKGSVAAFRDEIEKLRAGFPPGGERVDYRVKEAKLAVLRKIYGKQSLRKIAAFEKFRGEQKFWLTDYALFKAIKQAKNQSGWQQWDPAFRDKEPGAVEKFAREHADEIGFHEWLQWQLFEQFSEVKEHARKKDVLLMGDIPFLVSRDSADVWSHQNYFKLHLSSGAPPDVYFALGQRWGMPPYDWGAISANGYDYLKSKLKYAENFYDLFRIDHVVGVFRLWTISLDEPAETCGLNGRFDPENEGEWEEHGRRLLRVMSEAADMLPCAEDLGVIPECSNRVLAEFGIPGMDVQRWTKYWGTSYDFKKPEEYRRISMSIISSHDMSNLAGWWQFEAGTVDEELFKRQCEASGISFDQVRTALFDGAASNYGRLRWKKEIRSDESMLAALGKGYDEAGFFVDAYKGSFEEKKKFWNYLGFEGEPSAAATPAFIETALRAAGRTSSVFSIQLLQDFFSLDRDFRFDPWKFRINFPGTMDDKNWSLVIPFPLEDYKKSPITKTVGRMNEETGRAE